MYAVELSGISKTFGNVRANDDVSLQVSAGSIHAIAGENGAGKSTLTHIIYGMLSPSSGTMKISGREVSFSSPRDAIEAGIGMVHQHFMLVRNQTVAENIILGRERTPLAGIMKRRNISEDIASMAERHDMALDPDAIVGELSVGEEQRVEILKLLYRNASVLILDEPTAVLTPGETAQLFSTLRSLKREGKTVILITHKLDEVLEISDTVSVMRRGNITATVPTSSVSKKDLARMMVGRDVLLRVNNPPSEPGPEVLDINALSLVDRKRRRVLDELSLSVRTGEIYGIAGVEGNGQNELLDILWGMHDRESRITGSIRISGTDLIGLSPKEIADMGVSHIPGDRLRHGVIREFSVSENMLFGRHRETCFHRFGGFRRESVLRFTEEMTALFDIRYSPGPDIPVSMLSGGNQQKIVLARELNRPGLKLLLLAHPTRGVDIGAIELIHRRIVEARRNGLAILLVSSELDEIIALSTRIGCMYKGRIRHEFAPEHVTEGRFHQKEFEKEIGMHIT
ncbi:MAG: ABC transporter ATP-binding protein [Prosthecochloris sp.]|nr:ABC transporter ATP-binding protein [Prosthecochloris sp.]